MVQYYHKYRQNPERRTKMLLVHPTLISKIDKYASEALGIPVRELMRRAGEAVANVVRTYVKKGSRIAVFAGKGNNGGDGYAAAGMLIDEYDITVYDVFSAGQKTEEGRYFLDELVSRGGTVKALDLNDDFMRGVLDFDAFVDAVFGTGFMGELPHEAIELAKIFESQPEKIKIAIDTPLGVNAADGSLLNGASYHADATVVLGFIKTGIVSYPAKEYVGKIIFDDLSLQNNDVLSAFDFSDYYIDSELAVSLLPEREENSSKGCFGKLLVACGSPAFAGAAHLSLEGSLRGGVGYVTFLGEKTMCDALVLKFPEAIYKPTSIPNLTASDLDGLYELFNKQTAILVGSGSSKSEGLFRLVSYLLNTEGAPLILDADAINVIAEKGEEGRALVRTSKRTVILTPHPLELSRLSGISTDIIQANRISVAKAFAAENNCILVLKGAATVVTDGSITYVNSTGSSALAKAGSGDVLAGFLSSLAASGASPVCASAIAVYFHGLAADILADDLSELGVTPSDLPKEICRQIAKARKEKHRDFN